MSTDTERIKERLDLADVISEYVQLKRAGNHFKGLCPFHQEKSPSFIVSPDKGIWHCFGCFPPGQKIKTPFGYHSIEDINEDHYVTSGKSEIRKVLATHQRHYVGDLVKIRLRKLTYPVRLTTDHQVLVVRPKGCLKLYKVFSRRYRKYLRYAEQGQVEKSQAKIDRYFPLQKIAAGELKYGDLLLYPLDDAIEDQSVIDLGRYQDPPHRFGPIPPPLQLTQPVGTDLLKLIGYYIAEGSNHRAYIRFSLGNHEEDFAREITRLVKKLFHINASIYRRPSLERTGIEVTACHAHLATIFANLVGKGASEKHIPFEWQRLPPNKLKVLVDAIHRGDGTRSISSNSPNERKSITTVSRTLAEQTIDILLRGSIFPNIHIKPGKQDKKGVNHRDAYTVYWSEEAQSRYNLVYMAGGTRYWLLPIRSLKRRKYQGPVYNLTVDHDHSYVATSFAVANCGEGGDAFSFVQKAEGLDFPATLKLLAERAGVELTEKVHAKSTDPRTRLYECLQLAARFYHEILVNQKAGEKALAYLHERGVTDPTIAHFDIGYAPFEWDLVQQFLRRKGFAPADLLAAGLTGTTTRGTAYDRFRGRIMFPIHDVQGRPVAFGGRIVPWHATGQEGKYINSPETGIYEKRRVVYNLHRAKKHLRQHEPCLVVEGYMDVVMLVQAGTQNVVASSGTAFTAEQVTLLKRYTNQLHFAFDGDAAGVHAAQTATAAALQQGVRVATIVFPTGLDPADVAQQRPTELHHILTTPVSLAEFLLARLKHTASGTERETVLTDILPIVRQVGNAVQQGEMIQQIATTLHIPESVIVQRLATTSSSPLPTAAATTTTGQTLLHADQLLLGLLLADLPTRQALWAQVHASYISHSATQQLFAALQEQATAHPTFLTDEVATLIMRLPAEVVPFAESLAAVAHEQLTYSHQSAEQTGVSVLHRLQRRHLETELRRLQQSLGEYSGPEHQQALREFQAAAEALAAVTE